MCRSGEDTETPQDRCAAPSTSEGRVFRWIRTNEEGGAKEDVVLSLGSDNSGGGLTAAHGASRSSLCRRIEENRQVRKVAA